MKIFIFWNLLLQKGDIDMIKFSNKICALFAFVLMAVIVLGLTGCGTYNDKEIKIGLICSRNEISDKYPDMLLGMEFGVEDAKSKYGNEKYNISVEIFDDKGQSEEAAVQAKKALNDKSIDYIAVMSSDERLDLASEILAGGKKITFWLDDLGQAVKCDEYSNQFYLTYDISDRAEMITDFLKKENVETLNVLYSAKNANGGIGHELIQEADSLGIKVTSQVMLNSFSSEEYKTKLKNEMPDAVAVMTENPEENAKIIRAAKMVLSECIIVTDSFMGDINFVKKSQWLMEDVVIPPEIKSDWDESEVDKIEERYEAIYGNPVQSERFFHGYFALMELVEATVNCKTSKADTVCKYLTSPTAGRYGFNNAGVIKIGDATVIKIKDGELLKAE